MPLQNGEYERYTADEIEEEFQERLAEQLDTTAQAGDLVSAQLRAEAEVLAEYQEAALQRVHQAAYLADAEGKELDKVVDIIGLSRLTASPATGVVRFSRDTPPTADYVAPNGAVVQTRGSDPVRFETTEQVGLKYIDGFEVGFNGWERDVASFSVIETTELSGANALEVPANAGKAIQKSNETFSVGTTFCFDAKLSPDADLGFQFGVQDANNYFEVVFDQAGSNLKLREVSDGAEATFSENTSATIPADTNIHVEVEWSLYGNLTATVYQNDSRETAHCTVTHDSDIQWPDGTIAIKAKTGDATTLVDELSTRSVLANIEAIGDGNQTNVGPEVINSIASTITGVETVTNPIPTGKPTEFNTNYDSLKLGENRESDEELRERAFDSTSIGGAATFNAISTELQRLEGVKAVTLNRNRENTAVNGLPPHSFEAIVYGGTDKDVASAIFQTASIDSHDVGGVNGTKVEQNVTSSITGDTETISFSRPNTLNLNITIELVVDENYVGDAEIRSIITKYVGGTDLNGNFVNGLDVGEDLYEAVLKRQVVAPTDTGVWEVNSLVVDTGTDGTDDTTTTPSGADVLEVADNEVAVTNARDGSITINTSLK